MAAPRDQTFLRQTRVAAPLAKGLFLSLAHLSGSEGRDASGKLSYQHTDPKGRDVGRMCTSAEVDREILTLRGSDDLERFYSV